MFRTTLAITALAAAIVGCAGPDRDAYVERNRAVLADIPVFPGARLTVASSSVYRERDLPVAGIAGYGTTRTYRLPTGVSGRTVIAFYRRALPRAWKLVDLSAAPSGSWRKGDAYLHVLAGRGRVFVEVDHDYCKSGAAPGCFGP